MVDMGEIIRKLGTISFMNQAYDIELNKPVTKEGVNEIHIQNDKVRLAIPESEFLQMAACLRLAKRQLDLIKSGEGVDER